MQKKSPWLAVKAHYLGNFPNDLVGLHNFEGGYCGVSKVEDNRINICYITNYEAFKPFKNVEDFQQEVVCKNPHLKVIFENASLLFEKPLTISQICFDKKEAIENHILMIGDTAGLIHPLCGNGMAMAIHSAKIVSELVVKFHNGKIESRTKLEKKYSQEWNQNFKSRLATGRFLAKILQNEKFASFIMQLLVILPFLLPKIIKRTHGKPIKI
jgi:flavin-dependent dehydrogenase